MLDDLTLRIIFALTALVLLVLFFTTYRSTRSRYSFGWTTALAYLLAGGAAYLFIDTSAQAWGVPVGHTLTIAGLVWAWGAARSLRMKSLSVWHFVVPAAVVGTAAALDSPATNALAGEAALFAATAVVMGLTARELLLLDGRYSRSRGSLLVVSTVMSAYYLFRFVAVLADGFGNDVVLAAASETTATVITELLLIVVSFSMAGLSHDEVAQRLSAKASRASRELDQGARVQRRLLAGLSPQVSGYPVAGVCVPSRELSGDFFDWRRSDDGLVVTVGDVMGKGVGAAMLGATVRAGLRLADPGDPRAAVRAVMTAVGDDLVDNDSFVTLFHAHLESDTGRLTVLDAGHGLAMIVRRDGSREGISSVNLPVGLGVDQNWKLQTLTLEPGDRLLIFSDGVLDLFDGSVASLQRAADVAVPRTDGDWSVYDATERIRALADRGTRDDDVTLVAVERLPQPAATEVPAALGEPGAAQG